jgi:hypothetical protein
MQSDAQDCSIGHCYLLVAATGWKRKMIKPDVPCFEGDCLVLMFDN